MESRRAKRREIGSRRVKDFCYTVVKEHHRYGWLRQERLLVITLTHINNCKPPQRKGAPPLATKSFPLTSITAIGIKGTNYFYIHVSGDHTYYYYTPKAIEIALKIQNYVASANAIDILLDAEDVRRSILMEKLIKGSIQLPGTRKGQEDSPYPWSNPRMLGLRCGINRALLKGWVSGSEELLELAHLWKGKGEEDVMDLNKLRHALNAIKDKCLKDLLQRRAKPPKESFCSAVAVCVEDVLQRSVIQPNFDKIISFLREDRTLLRKEVLFNRQRERLRGRSAEVFNVPKDLRSIDYKLVRRHFDVLTNLRSPNDLIDQVVNIAACIFLTVYVAARYSRKTAAAVAINSVTRGACGNAVMNRHTAALPRRSMPAEAKAVRPLTLHGNKKVILKRGEREEKKESDVLRSIDSCFNSMELFAVSQKVPASSFSDDLVVSGKNSLDRVSMDSASQLCCHGRGESRKMSFSLSLNKIIDDIEEEEEEEELNVPELQLNAALIARLDKGGLTADEIFPLFIHLLCETDVPELCIIERFIDLMRDPDDTSERAYYFTTLAAAIKTVCEWNCEDVPSMSNKARR
ncbi:hypothetical protein Tc00.1047053511003.150 [Trypanosoma cruzi]|uniref:VPS9 domain-containing protein n=1 Tax=Trypanosoma cruzi (strain CL Brener) TaxID=353153 RepID=Q4DNT5_TRYCC|nr:hypothetical protein Tc00.1047053511003.150 [Trypanosoma cruzi]EAN94193.1 hypothetical protein Tc00.1047053511003.150 [Trypanosoma cruzi]|eukprot:XP_816044.1 hypothetical protein [Trypanosoma cruzi strain CL Brener]